jgi:hypothetical protein
MPKSNDFDSDLLLLAYNNTNIGNLGDAVGVRGSTVIGSVFAALHGASPLNTGKQNANELAYTNYTRVAVARNIASFTVAGQQATNAGLISFPQCGVTGAVAKFWSTGYELAGATKILHYGNLTTPGVLPVEFTADDLGGDTVVVPNNTFAVNDELAVYALPGSTMAGGLVDGTSVFVKTAAGDVLTLSATAGGATLNITGVGQGLFSKIVPLQISNLITPKILAGQMLIREN